VIYHHVGTSPRKGQSYSAANPPRASGDKRRFSREKTIFHPGKTHSQIE
jgi:hypothetical protein